eukprot:9502117-Pyramimonas_sp.AAC.1
MTHDDCSACSSNSPRMGVPDPSWTFASPCAPTAPRVNFLPGADSKAADAGDAADDTPCVDLGGR